MDNEILYQCFKCSEVYKSKANNLFTCPECKGELRCLGYICDLKLKAEIIMDKIKRAKKLKPNKK